MVSAIDSYFSDDLELTQDAPQDLEAALLWMAGADTPHAEDAFLADFARWLGARGADAAERRAGLELAREALDLLGDPDGAWQALPIERWLRGADGSAGASSHAIALARDLVGFLAEHGRLSLHGQRVLTRRIAGVRVRDRAPRPHADGADPKLAA